MAVVSSHLSEAPVSLGDVIPPPLGESEVQNVNVLLESKPGILYLSPHFAGFLLQSKGGILSKACDYIQELRQSNHRLSEELQGLDQLQLDNDVLRQQVRLLSSVWPSSTPRPPPHFGTPYFIFHREAFTFFLSPVDV